MELVRQRLSLRNGKTYFVKDGVVTTGAHKVGAKWYFFAEDGTTKSGIVKDSAGKWYYITAEGERKTGLIKGCWR